MDGTSGSTASAGTTEAQNESQNSTATSGQNQSASGTTATSDGNGQGTATNSIDFNNLIPEEYRAKPWVQELSKSSSPVSELFKQYEHAQSLIGSRGPSIPDANATPEQLKAFHKALGVPDKVEDYAVENTPWKDEADKQLGEYITAGRTDAFINALKVKAMEVGILPKQFEALLHAHDLGALEFAKEELAQRAKAEQEQAQDFDVKAAKLFGADWSRVIGDSRALMHKFVPEAMRAKLETLDNDSLLVLAGVTNELNKQFFREDSMSKGSGTTTLATVEDVNKELGKLFASEAFKDPFHADNARVQAQIQEHIKKIDAIQRR